MDDVPYDALAEIYDWLVPDALLTPRLSAEAFSPITAELAPGSRVLDCAAGTGQLAVGLALRGFEVVATDASGEMVRRVRRLADEERTDLRALTCSWEELDEAGFEDSFDAVFCVGNSLVHAAGRDARCGALRAMGRVLRPGGLLALTSRNWARIRARGAAVVVFGDRGKVATQGERLSFWPFTPEMLDEDLDAAGLVPESSTFAPGVERYLVTARRPA
jgi:SAM-dependent methyltransferase